MELPLEEGNRHTYKADLIVKNTFGQIVFHIEVDSKFWEETVPIKFDKIPAKYKLWIYLPTGYEYKKPQNAEKKFFREAKKLKDFLQNKNQNLRCILKYPDLEALIVKMSDI